jgi:IS6 family transposase
MECGKKWYYFYRAVDAEGSIMHFLWGATRDAKAAERLFRKALRARHTALPRVLTVEKHAAYPRAIDRLQQEGPLPAPCTLRQGKYLNNMIEQDHRFIKRRGHPGLGLDLSRTAQRTLQGDEARPRIRKGQVKGIAKGDVLAQHRVIAQLFGLVA